MDNQTGVKLSALQLELLKVFSFNPTEEELKQVRKILAHFFAHRFTENVAKAGRARNVTDEDLDKWLEEDEQ
ncbi:MAG: hypothetical protein KDD12_22865 [Lewinella sp.]|nr:hypothetical protein [Lewinella sp.]